MLQGFQGGAVNYFSRLVGVLGAWWSVWVPECWTGGVLHCGWTRKNSLGFGCGVAPIARNWKSEPAARNAHESIFQDLITTKVWPASTFCSVWKSHHTPSEATAFPKLADKETVRPKRAKKKTSRVSDAMTSDHFSCVRAFSFRFF